MSQAAIKGLIFAATLCMVGLYVRPGHAELSISISTDLKGSISFLEDSYQRNDSQSSVEDESSGGDESSSPSSSSSFDDFSIETKGRFRVIPPLRVRYRYPVIEQQSLQIGVHGSFGYLNLRLRYSDGITISAGERNVSFIEPVSFTLESINFGFGSYMRWQVTRNLSVNASLTRVNQRLELSSTLGSWNMNDRLQRSFVEWSSAVEYTIFDSLTGDSVRPSLFLSFADRPKEKEIGLGLQFAFE